MKDSEGEVRARRKEEVLEEEEDGEEGEEEIGGGDVSPRTLARELAAEEKRSRERVSAARAARRRRVRPPPLLALASAATTFALVFAVLGYVFSGSFTWGWFDRLRLGSARERLAQEAGRAGLRAFTPEELALHDGSDPSRPLLLAIKGKVFDVTEGSRFYGPTGSYRLLAGKDASRGYFSGCFANERLHDLRGLTDAQMESIDSWLNFFVEAPHYPLVGTVHVEVDESLPPPSDECGGGL